MFLDCHAIGNDLPVDYDELGFVPLNRTCGRSTSAWCQLGNGLRIVNGGGGQWKQLYAPEWAVLLMLMMVGIRGIRSTPVDAQCVTEILGGRDKDLKS